MSRGRPFKGVIVLSAALFAGSCGGDETTSSTTPTTGSPPSVTAESVPTVGVQDACAVVPTADVAAMTELAVDDGVAAGDERRRVCTFQDATNDVGITVGIEAAGRFDEKAEVSRRALDDDGEEIGSVVDRALFFFSDDDLPEGVGGVLVAAGEVTIDVTMQGLLEDRMRTASINIAELAVSNL